MDFCSLMLIASLATLVIAIGNYAYLWIIVILKEEKSFNWGPNSGFIQDVTVPSISMYSVALSDHTSFPKHKFPLNLADVFYWPTISSTWPFPSVQLKD